jgi:signal transduction histidine kinase
MKPKTSKWKRPLKRDRLAAPAGPAISDQTRLQMALEAADMVTWDWDVRTGLLYFCENLPTKLAGDNDRPYRTIIELLENIHPEDRDRVARAMDLTENDGTPVECECRTRLLDGNYHWVLVKGVSVIMQGGIPVRVLGVTQEITARKQIEEDLHRRSRQLAELAAELIMVEYHERRRLADLVREHLQQLLVAARIQVHTMTTTAKGPERQQLESLRHTLEATLEVTRSITKDLAPPAHPHEDCSMAFAWLAQEMHKRYQLAVDVKIGSDFSEPDEVRTVLLFTAARELLQNVVMHAGTRKARLRLQRLRHGIELEVKDRGKGFDPQLLRNSKERQGFGLFSIRERTELLGGKLSVVSAAGRGTRVVLSLPIVSQQPV